MQIDSRCVVAKGSIEEKDGSKIERKKPGGDSLANNSDSKAGNEHGGKGNELTADPCESSSESKQANGDNDKDKGMSPIVVEPDLPDFGKLS